MPVQPKVQLTTGRGEWTPEHQMAFEEVKGRLVADPVIACQAFGRTFILQTDASD